MQSLPESFPNTAMETTLKYVYVYKSVVCGVVSEAGR
jgi:hypothetical protein